MACSLLDPAEFIKDLRGKVLIKGYVDSFTKEVTRCQIIRCRHFHELNPSAEQFYLQVVVLKTLESFDAAHNNPLSKKDQEGFAKSLSIAVIQKPQSPRRFRLTAKPIISTSV
ncbi:uncharacterized protein LOC108200474 isoform X2 [Daucus carota subsp. sativus]|uniref:uncharacterized protein LOC108200474 isoform X2 n=1 Tax=Daucus carota subsp. sativus TaxID=79200 RepID=UPI003082E77E